LLTSRMAIMGTGSDPPLVMGYEPNQQRRTMAG
jgi:hypothetical protein